jgi:hypothetical protein
MHNKDNHDATEKNYLPVQNYSELYSTTYLEKNPSAIDIYVLGFACSDPKFYGMGGLPST